MSQEELICSSLKSSIELYRMYARRRMGLPENHTAFQTVKNMPDSKIIECLTEEEAEKYRGFRTLLQSYEEKVEVR